MKNCNKENRIPVVLFVADLPHMGGSVLSLKDMILSLGNRIKPIVIVSAKGETYDYFCAANIETYIVPFKLRICVNKHRILLLPRLLASTAKYYYLNWKGNRVIKRILRGREIDIIHSNTCVIDFGYKLSLYYNIPHVWHIREMLDTFDNTYYLGSYRILRKKMESTNKLIFISNACKDYWNLNTNEKAVSVIGDAVISEREKSSICPKDRYFLFCSQRLSDFKGSHIALRAFGKSGLGKIGYRLKFIGKYSNKYKRQLDDISNYFGIRDSVDYLGMQNHIQIKQYMSKAIAFLQCSKMEGLGRTVIEAMFYGCPVIAKNCGGTLDFVFHNDTGFLWNNEEECAELMKQIINKDISKLTINAQAYVMKNYSIEHYGEKIMNVYNELLNGKRS